MKIINIFRNKYLFTSILFILLFTLLFLNFIFMQGGSHSIKNIFIVLQNPHHEELTTIGQISAEEYSNISTGIWSAIATAIAAVGLSLAGLATQALTKNPLADASTLGMTQAAIFAIIVALSFGMTSYYIKFSFALIGATTASILLLLIIFIGKGKTSIAKIVLAGLAIGVIFKTLSFLVRHGDKTLDSVSFNYVLGGAESVVSVIGKHKWLFLYISSGLISLSLIIMIFISRGLTLLELGDERAKNLGTKVKTIKFLAIIVIILTVPSAVIIVGNLAFIGLFSVHIARYFTKSRNYLVILLPAIVFATVISSLGLFITNWVPTINSGLWMTFIGAPYIIYAGMKGLR